MKFGLGLLTSQVPPDDDRTITEKYREIIEMVEVAEAAGFDSAWLSEHHATKDDYLSAQFPMAAAIAEATTDITIGTGIALAPLYDPIRLAEDVATVDALSGGRFHLGLGIGYRDREFEQFGVPKSERVPRLIDCVNVCKRAWEGGEFSYDGHVFEYDDAIVNPTPPQGTDLPIVLGAFSESGTRRTARLGDGYISTPTLTFDGFETRLDWLADEGIADDFRIYAMREGFLADSEEKSWQLMKPGYFYVKRQYDEWFSQSSDFGGKGSGTSDNPEEIWRDWAMTGTPDQLREQIHPYEDVLDSDDHFIIRLEYPGMDQETVLEAIERFGDEVIPTFN